MCFLHLGNKYKFQSSKYYNIKSGKLDFDLLKNDKKAAPLLPESRICSLDVKIPDASTERWNALRIGS